MADINQILQFSKKLTLLYVEDNKAIKDMTLMLLKNFFNNIIVAEDGEDGLEKFNSNNIDIIISDITMPKMDGLEMAKNIKKIDLNIPIIVISGHSDNELLEKGQEIGLKAYLFKPFDLNKFLEVLENLRKGL